jgi:hypothetical protein
MYLIQNMLAKFQATFMTHGFSCVQNEKKLSTFK